MTFVNPAMHVATIGLVFSVSLALGQGADTGKDLEAWWSFNDASGRGVFDQSAAAHHGRWIGKLERPTGRMGGAFRGAIGNYVSASLPPHVLGSGPYTIAAWVKADGDQGGKERIIVGKPGFHGGLLAHSQNGDTAYGFTLWNQANRPLHLMTPKLDRPGEWHFLAVVFESRVARLYLDGELVKRGDFEGEFRDYGTDVFIGGQPRGSHFLGLIDEVRIYRRALSDRDVKVLMEVGDVAVPGFVPGEEPLPQVDLAKDRPELSRPLFKGKPVIAHYMTQMNSFAGDKAYFMNPDYGRPDGPASNVGGAFPYESIFARTTAGKSPEEVIETEIRAAKRMGVDGFHFYYQSPAPGPNPGEENNQVIRKFFKVVQEKNLDFKLTLCISHPNQPIEASEKIRACAKAIRPLLSEFKDSPAWLRSPDGRIVFFTWATEGFSDGVRNYGELFTKPDVENQVKALAEGYEKLRLLIGVPAAFVFHAWDMDAMYMNARGGGRVDLTNQYKRYIDGVLGYFPALTGFADYPANADTTAEWREVAAACKAKGRSYGQALLTDYVKTYKRDGKLPRAADFPGLPLAETKSLYLPFAGAQAFRTLWQRAVDFDADFASYVTWNDYPEGHHLAPEVHHNFAFAVLNEYYEKKWRLGQSVPAEDVALAFYHKYPIGAKPLVFPMKAEVVPWHLGRVPLDPKIADVVDVVALLKSPASIFVNGVKRLDAPAGLAQMALPMEIGPVVVEIRRGNAVVETLRPPEWITDKPFRTDRLIYGYSTKCAAMAKEMFGNLAIPKADDYAPGASGIPNWRTRYRIPQSNVAEAQTPAIAIPRIPTPTGAFSPRGPVMEIATAAGIKRLPLENPREPWGGARDLSGNLHLAHDGAFIYLKVVAMDDIHMDPVEDPSQMWKADSIQVGVATSEGRSNLECGLALRGDKALFVSWQSPVHGAEGLIERQVLGSPGKVEYVLRIPLKMFGLRPGDSLGLSALINDADGGDRKAFLEFGSGIGTHKDPASYGAYRLEP